MSLRCRRAHYAGGQTPPRQSEDPTCAGQREPSRELASGDNGTGMAEREAARAWTPSLPVVWASLVYLVLGRSRASQT